MLAEFRLVLVGQNLEAKRIFIHDGMGKISLALRAIDSHFPEAAAYSNTADNRPGLLGVFLQAESPFGEIN